ncbi:MAG: protein kinase [Planctomycetes bacterium]|nr:protein kinase [Planctomycetota bacterium]
MDAEKDQVFAEIAVRHRLLAPAVVDKVWPEYVKELKAGKTQSFAHYLVGEGLIKAKYANVIHRMSEFLSPAELSFCRIEKRLDRERDMPQIVVVARLGGNSPETVLLSLDDPPLGSGREQGRLKIVDLKKWQDDSGGNLVGRVFGEYFLKRVLGKGAMGTVYRAEQVDTKKPVAIKALLSHFAKLQTYVDRFKLEGEAASRLSHENIVKVEGVIEDQGWLLLVMEYIRGRSLGEKIRDEGKIEIVEVVDVMRCVLRGLQHAHENGVLHRDIKPDNILIADDGSVKLLDFGLAMIVDSGGADLTQAGTVVGTPKYIAPERARGEDATPASDLYSLGVSFYHAVVGEVPFESATASGYMKHHICTPAKDPRIDDPEIPERVAEVIMRLLEKDPAKRYQSAAEVLDELADPFAAPRDKFGVIEPEVADAPEEPDLPEISTDPDLPEADENAPSAKPGRLEDTDDEIDIEGIDELDLKVDPKSPARVESGKYASVDEQLDFAANPPDFKTDDNPDFEPAVEPEHPDHIIKLEERKRIASDILARLDRADKATPRAKEAAVQRARAIDDDDAQEAPSTGKGFQAPVIGGRKRIRKPRRDPNEPVYLPGSELEDKKSGALKTIILVTVPLLIIAGAIALILSFTQKEEDNTQFRVQEWRDIQSKLANSEIPIVDKIVMTETFMERLDKEKVRTPEIMRISAAAEAAVNALKENLETEAREAKTKLENVALKVEACPLGINDRSVLEIASAFSLLRDVCARPEYKHYRETRAWKSFEVAPIAKRICDDVLLRLETLQPFVDRATPTDRTPIVAEEAEILRQNLTYVNEAVLALRTRIQTFRDQGIGTFDDVEIVVAPEIFERMDKLLADVGAAEEIIREGAQ